ncbi:MAG: hypothetical protein RIA71_04530 [Oceanicaulis sp.]
MKRFAAPGLALSSVAFVLGACGAQKDAAELMELGGPGEVLFASDIRSLSPEGRDLVIEITPEAHARLQAYCNAVGDAAVTAHAAGRILDSQTGCSSLDEASYRLQGAARSGSELPDRLDDFIALQAQGSTQPVLELLELRATSRLDQTSMQETRWSADAMSFAPSGRLADMASQPQTESLWMIAYDGEVLGGWNRVDVTPERIALHTRNAPAMAAWKASLED